MAHDAMKAMLPSAYFHFAAFNEYRDSRRQWLEEFLWGPL
jgi:hypothetical protein